MTDNNPTTQSTADAGTGQQTTTAAAGPDLATLQAELETVKAKAKENEESARYWHEQAKGKQPAAAKPEAETEDSTDLLDVVSKGPKALKEWLGKQGFVDASEVDKRVENRAQQIMREADLTRQYPDLKDAKSDFFKATAGHYQMLKANGVPEHMAMELAAERVEAEQFRSGKKADPAPTPKPGRGNDEERTARARAQQGDTGRRTSADAAGESDELTATQKAICSKMGISEEAYMKRAKEGVQFAKQ